MGRSEKAIQRVEEGKGKTEEKLDEVMREMRPPVTPSPAPASARYSPLELTRRRHAQAHHPLSGLRVAGARGAVVERSKRGDGEAARIRPARSQGAAKAAGFEVGPESRGRWHGWRPSRSGGGGVWRQSSGVALLCDACVGCHGVCRPVGAAIARVAGAEEASRIDCAHTPSL